MIKAWRRWRETTSLSNGTFLKFYMWSQVIIKPKRRIRRFWRRFK